MSAGDETRDHDPGERSGPPDAGFDALCTAFSVEWRAGRGRSADDFLRAIGRDPGADPVLDAELHKVEAYYRKARFAPGTLLADRYRVEAVLGVGGMGVV